MSTVPQEFDLAEGVRRLQVANAALADEVERLRGEVEKWTADPQYQYAGSGPINRAAIECRNAEIDLLRKLIGYPTPHTHPSEWQPRATTWHHERANWVAEVERLRQALSDAEQVLSRESAKAAEFAHALDNANATLNYTAADVEDAVTEAVAAAALRASTAVYEHTSWWRRTDELALLVHDAVMGTPDESDQADDTPVV